MSKSAADICRERGWTAGTRIAGSEGHGLTVIEITAVGEEEVLAKTISHNGEPTDPDECIWTLDCRDWKKVTDPERGHLYRPGEKGPINVEMAGGEQ